MLDCVHQPMLKPEGSRISPFTFGKALLASLILFCFLAINATVYLQALDVVSLSMLRAWVVAVFALIGLSMLMSKRGNILSLEILSFGLFCLFLISPIFLDVLLNTDYSEVVRIWVSREYEYNTVYTAYLTLLNAGVGLWAAAILSSSRVRAARENQFSSPSPLLPFLPVALAYAFCAFIISTQNLRVGAVVQMMGYADMHSGAAGGKGFGHYIVEQASSVFFVLGLLAAKTKRRFIILGLLTMLIVATHLSTGRRAMPFAMIIVFFVFAKDLYGFRINYKALVIAAILGAYVSVALGEYRKGPEAVKYGVSLERFLVTQGASYHTVPLAAELTQAGVSKDFGLSNVFADTFMLLDKFAIRLSGTSEKSLDERATEFGYSGYLITRQLSESLLEQGLSTGTSFVAELFLLGGRWMVLIGSFLTFSLFFRLNRASNTTLFIVFWGVYGADVLVFSRMSYSTLILPNLMHILAIVVLLQARVAIRA